jgi:glycosyltransferase involved in cell wall biosynthesis
MRAAKHPLNPAAVSRERSLTRPIPEGAVAKREKILIDGSVFVLSEMEKTSRTGIYFLLKDLVLTLSARDDVALRFFFQCAFAPGTDTKRLLMKALSGLRPPTDGPDDATWRVGIDRVNVISGSVPLRADLQRLPNVNLYQVVHDLTGHACGELGAATIAFERDIVSGLGAAGHAVCISNNTRMDLYRYFGFPLDRSTVVYPAIRSDIFVHPNDAASAQAMRRSIGLKPEAPYVLALSTLEPRKNLVTSINAFARVVEALPDREIYFVIAGVKGWGDQLSALKSISPRAASRIIVGGYVPDAVVTSLLSNALCLVYPSLYEGFGLPALEAMTCGTPVIVSDRGSLPEVVGSAGVVVSPFDERAIAETIIGWARSDLERQKWSDRARTQAAKFSWQESVEKLVRFMKSRVPVSSD